jgi:hypothetical protein
MAVGEGLDNPSRVEVGQSPVTVRVGAATKEKTMATEYI